MVRYWLLVLLPSCKNSWRPPKQSIYKEKPQIKLTSPDQVRILEEGEEFPPPGAAKAGEERGEEKPMPKKAAEKSDEGKKEEPKKKPPVDPKKYFK